MDRLTKRNDDGSVISAIECTNGCEYLNCSMEEGYNCNRECEADVMCKLAEYEDAEEQGLLLRLPCKVGDALYVIAIEEGVVGREVLHFEIYENTLYAHVGLYAINLTKHLGKIVFLTKEEAEQKLAEMKGE